MCNSCNGKFAFEMADKDAMAAAAKSAHEKREAWHFHVLAPNCAFSPNPKAYTFLLELTDQDRMVCCFFDERPVAVNKELLALLHGTDALSDKKAAEGSIDAAGSELLDMIGAAATAGKSWHHHMMFPACKLNGADGKWRLFVEVEGQQPTLLDHDSEPSLVLNRIERLYFGLS